MKKEVNGTKGSLEGKKSCAWEKEIYRVITTSLYWGVGLSYLLKIICWSCHKAGFIKINADEENHGILVEKEIMDIWIRVQSKGRAGLA